MRSQIRIAVLFFGQPRFIKSKLAAASHRFHLRKYQVSYFGHVWFDKNVDRVQTAPWANLGEVKLPEKSIEILSQSFPGIILDVEMPRIFDPQPLIDSLELEPGELLTDVLKKEIENIPNTLSQFYSLYRAFELFGKSDLTFDFLAVSRYDNFIWNFPKLFEISRDEITLSNHHPNFPDLIYISKPENLKFLACYPRLSELCVSSRQLSAESIKYRSYLTSETPAPLKPRYLDVTILRSANFVYSVYILVSQKLRRSLRIRSRIRDLAKLLSINH